MMTDMSMNGVWGKASMKSDDVEYILTWGLKPLEIAYLLSDGFCTAVNTLVVDTKHGVSNPVSLSCLTL